MNLEKKIPEKTSFALIQDHPNYYITTKVSPTLNIIISCTHFKGENQEWFATENQ